MPLRCPLLACGRLYCIGGLGSPLNGRFCRGLYLPLRQAFLGQLPSMACRRLHWRATETMNDTIAIDQHRSGRSFQAASSNRLIRPSSQTHLYLEYRGNESRQHPLYKGLALIVTLYERSRLRPALTIAKEAAVARFIKFACGAPIFGVCNTSEASPGQLLS